MLQVVPALKNSTQKIQFEIKVKNFLDNLDEIILHGIISLKKA